MSRQGDRRPEIHEEGSSQERSRILLTAAVLLALHAALAMNSLVRENPTIDEVIHLPAGITYWQTGTFKLYHHNPPLVKLVAALPALASGPEMTDLYKSEHWRGDRPIKDGFAHLFAEKNAGHYFEIFTRARLLMPLFSVLGGLVVFLWSRRLYGDKGGLHSLALWAFCPNLLAHARLITTDVGATALGAGATFVFWIYLHRPSWRLATVAGVALGVAQLAKFSMLLLYGLWPVFWALREIASADRMRLAARVGKALAQGVWIVLLSVVVIDVGYGFEVVGLALERFEFSCRTLTRPVDPPRVLPSTGNELFDLARAHRVNRFRGTILGHLPAPLPKHYLLGFDDQKLEAETIPTRWFRPDAPEDQRTGYPVYLDGELRDSGWWYYYLDCLRYKMPEGTILLVALSWVVLLASRRSRAPWSDELILLLPPLVILGAMSFGTDINLGLRYVLPIFPYLIIAAGKLAPWASGMAGMARRAAAWALIGAALLETVIATIAVHPHYLAFFNWASGGPRSGPDHLIDSNLDWGQDLVNLRDWIKRNPNEEPVGLAYFGQINPLIFEARREGFRWFLPPARPGTIRPLPKSHLRNDPEAPLKPGLYAVSASLVRGLPWRVYDPTRIAYWKADKHAFSYFQELTPFDNIGYSIFLYRVTPEQADRLNRRIWQAPAGANRVPN
jgi:hypothetical protein